MPATEKEIKTEYERCVDKGWIKTFEANSVTYQLPLSYLLAFPSRETNMENIVGDYGNGISLMQIDRRWHPDFIKKVPDYKNNVKEYIDFGCALINQYVLWSKNHFPDYSYLKIGAACYNEGPVTAVKAIQRKDVDVFTTGHDYGIDILDRAAKFQKILDEKKDKNEKQYYS